MNIIQKTTGINIPSEDGAFTGARKGGKTGLFEEAHTGTIFLDEIGDASFEVQKRLLRVLEEKEVRKVGGNTVVPVDVRVIAATNQNLPKLMQEGKFRQDLYFRLCTIQIAVPSLKKRRTDIALLIVYFANRLYHRELLLNDQVRNYLLNYNWPGNIRELQNIVKFLCNMVDLGMEGTMRHLPAYICAHPMANEDVSPTLSTNKEVETVLSVFAELGAVEPLLWVLSELKKAEKFDRPVGRRSIAAALSNHSLPCPEHKVRLWLKHLEQGGCITTKNTKQGSRLTKLGDAVLALFEASPDGRNIGA